MRSRPGSPGPLRAAVREPGIWLLAAAGTLYFFRALFLHQTLFLRDLYLLFLPQKELFARLVLAGEPPLWNPFLHGGLPFLGDISNSVFYPSSLLYLLLPAIRALNVDIALHVVLASVAVYLLARVLGLSPVAAVASGLVYGYCGYTLSLTNLFVRILAMPYPPLLLLFFHRFLLESRTRWLLAGVCVGALHVFAGAPEMAVVSFLLAFGWGLVFPYPEGSLRPLRRAVAWLAMTVSSIAAGAVQLLPTMEMAAHAARGAGLDYETWAFWSLHPKRLLDLVLPGFLGQPDLLSKESYWGAILVDNNYPYVLSLYFGVLALALALLGALGRRGASPVPLAARRFLLACAGLGVLLALGRFLPGYGLLFHLPLADLFRYPIKFLSLALLPLALLAACGFERLFTTARPARRAVLWVWAGFVAGAALLAAYATLPGVAAVALEWAFGTATEGARNGIAGSARHALAVILLGGLLLQLRRLSPRSWQPWAFAAVLAADLMIAGRPVNMAAPETLFTEEPAVAETLRRHASGGRLYRPENPKGIRRLSPTDEAVWQYRWHLEVASFYTAARWSVPVIFHDDYHGLAPSRLINLGANIANLPWPRKLPLLSAGAVTLIISHERLEEPGLELLELIDNPSDTPFYLYRNWRAADRLGFVTVWQAVETEKEALAAIRHPNFDPRFHAAIEGAVAHSPPPGCDSAFQSRVEATSNRREVFSISTSCSGYLVIADPYHAGWRVEVDGQRVPVLRANSAFSAVRVEPGEHRVVRVFFPGSLYLGLAISLGALVVLGAAAWLRRPMPGAPLEAPRA